MYDAKYLSWRVAAIALTFVVGSIHARASDYPTSPIIVTLPLGPGGATENLALIATGKASETLGQRFVIQYKPGAGGSIASNAAAKSKPNGYTLLFANFATHTVTPTMYGSLPYDPIKDFIPVSLLASQAHVLLVNKDLGVNSIKDLIELQKKSDKPINFASSGIGSPLHLAAEYFQTTTGAKFGHIPYKSSKPALQDLIAGRVQVMFDNISTGKPYVLSGDLKAIAVTSAERSPLLPDVPTAEEQGLRGFHTYGWWGVLAPAGTPPDVIAKLSKAFQNAMASDDVKSKLLAQGYKPMGTDPDAFKEHIATEISRWSPVIEKAGLKNKY